MKNLISRLIFPFLFVSVACVSLLQLGSCSKEDPIIQTVKDTVHIKDTIRIRDTVYYDVVCPLRGTYTGSGTSHLGNSSYSEWSFRDNNFVAGKEAPGGTYVTFGGYRNTCDSVIMSVYYNTNASFYLLKGKFSNNRNTITGTFNNLTTPSDYGTFTVSK
jgi:hypothetical protein